MDESGGGQDCDPGQDFCEERDRGEIEESKQREGKHGQPVKDRNKRKKSGKDNKMKRSRHQFLILCFSYFLFYYFLLLDLLWLSIN